jgi:general secretion pathway protein G
VTRIAPSARAFTLIELVVTLTLVSVLALVAVPLYEVTTTRAKEAELRTSLRQIRSALDAYKLASDNGIIAHAAGESGYPPDLPTLVTGVDAILSAPVGSGTPAPAATGGFSSTGPAGFSPAGSGGFLSAAPAGFPSAGPAGGAGSAVPGPSHLVFLRAVPRDPFFPDQTVAPDQQWNLRAYASAPDDFSGGSDVFDVKSKSSATGMNGTPYKDW